MALVGYARVSTQDQDTALQRDALARHGVHVVFVESGSGVGPRPELHWLAGIPWWSGSWIALRAL